MTANSLGRALIAIMGLDMVIQGLLLLLQWPITSYLGSSYLGSGNYEVPGMWQLALLLTTIGHVIYSPLMGLALILLRGWLADILFGKDEKVDTTASTRDLTALLLFAMGIWYLVDSTLNVLSYVQWARTPDGFPFRFMDYSTRSVINHLVEGAIALALVFKCGWLSTRLTKVVQND